MRVEVLAPSVQHERGGDLAAEPTRVGASISVADTLAKSMLESAAGLPCASGFNSWGT
jgi:hypothetical protein